MLWRAHDNTGLGPRRARSNSDLTQTIAMQQKFVDSRQHASALRSRKQLTSRWSQGRSTLTTRSAAYDQRATSASPACHQRVISGGRDLRGVLLALFDQSKATRTHQMRTDGQIMMTTTPTCYKANGPPPTYYTAQIVCSLGNCPPWGTFWETPLKKAAPAYAGLVLRGYSSLTCCGRRLSPDGSMGTP